jgi:hypothetical protein
MKILNTFEVSVEISLSSSQKDLAKAMLNQHHVNDTKVNRWDKEKGFVPKYENHPNMSELKEAHARLNRTFTKFILVNLMSDGSLVICDKIS